MQESLDQLRQRNRMLEERISKLCAAVLRISASLDLETVRREIVQGARALNDARYGPITTVDDAGQAQDFVTVCPTRRAHEWPQSPTGRGCSPTSGTLRASQSGRPAGLRPGARLLDGRVSVEDAAARAGHRGVHVGSFFLGEKEGGPDFTTADESDRRPLAARTLAQVRRCALRAPRGS